MTISFRYFQIVTHLDLILEKYGRVLNKQLRLPVDYMADPRRRNNTWGPWLTEDMTMLYAYASAASIAEAVFVVHIAIAFLVLEAFL